MARERSTPIAQVVRFARPNIQIYDAHVVDLYQWVCARYLVGVKGAETKAKRSQAWLSTEFENGSRWIFTNPVAPREIRRSAIEKQKNTLYFNMICRREWDSNPWYGRAAVVIKPVSADSLPLNGNPRSRPETFGDFHLKIDELRVRRRKLVGGARYLRTAGMLFGTRS